MKRCYHRWNDPCRIGFEVRTRSGLGQYSNIGCREPAGLPLGRYGVIVRLVSCNRDGSQYDDGIGKPKGVYHCALLVRLNRDDMLTVQVLELASERVFVPMTVGGGIRSYTDDTGKVWSRSRLRQKMRYMGVNRGRVIWLTLDRQHMLLRGFVFGDLHVLVRSSFTHCKLLGNSFPLGPMM